MHIHLCDCRQLTENVELGERAWGMASTLFEAGSLLNSPVSVLSQLVTEASPLSFRWTSTQ